MLNVKQRQLNLKTYLYYYTGDIDGIEGILTIDAYIKFQRNNCLIVDGIYGPSTESKLILCIKDLQSLLNKHGYNLSIDGIVGNNTINAVKDFQSKNNLVIDGIVGEKTFTKLGNYQKNIISWDSIKYFVKDEFTCKCGCKMNNIDLKLVKILDDIRSHYNKQIIITSGCRCESHNNSVGGVKGSKHVLGKAADFYVKGISSVELLEYTKNLVLNGTLRYTYTNTTSMNGVVHIDIN